MVRHFLFAALALSALRADTYPRQPGIDVEHYIFRVTLSDDTDEIAGETTVTVRVKDGTRELALDLAAPMMVSDVSAPYRREADRIVMTLPAGELQRVTVKYRGKPTEGLKILKNKYGERCFFSANWPDLAHQWLPTVDHPYDKATGEFFVTAPAHYQVVANGALEEEIDLGDGRRLTHWNQKVPIATWLYNIGVAQFATRHFGRAAGVPLQTWVYHQDRDAGIATFEEASRRAVEFFSSHVGPFPYQKLANVQAAGMGGGMEHASEIFYGEKGVTGQPAYGLVAHETAHQWFGDSVTEKDWDDVWLSEGFATYFALLASEHYDGRDAFEAIARADLRQREAPARCRCRAGQAVEGHSERHRVSEGRVDAAHAPPAGRDAEVLGGHPAVLSPVPRPERVHRRLPPRDGRGLRAGPPLVLPAVAIPRGASGCGGPLLVQRRGEEDRAGADADAAGRPLPPAARPHGRGQGGARRDDAEAAAVRVRNGAGARVGDPRPSDDDPHGMEFPEQNSVKVST
jgi:hypothetical protein